MIYTNLNNKELYARCLELSGMIKKYRNQFIALLPEVNARKLYLEHGMYSIYEFAAKLACLSNTTVDRVLKVSHQLKNKPILKSMFERGEVGWSKLEVAVKLASPEKEIAKILPSISKEALVTLAKDSKAENFASVKLQEIKEVFSVKIDSNLMGQLRVLKKNLEKESRHPLSWEQTLGLIVSKLQEPPKQVKRIKPKNFNSRYIPASTKRQALQKTNQLCAKCNKPAEHLHHQVPYAISKSHESIIPLCKAHHDLVHHSSNTYVNRKYQKHKKMAPI